MLHALNSADVALLLRTLRSLAPIVPDWRCLVDALRRCLQGYWKALPDEQRGRFLRHLRSYWEIVRHRLAPRAHGELACLREQGQLRVRAGRLLRTCRGGTAIEIVVRERGQAHALAEEYDVLVRATGWIPTSTAPAMRWWASCATPARSVPIVRPGPARYRPVRGARPAGAPVRGLYCIGPLLRGQLWEITAVPELRVAARELAAQLLKAREALARNAGAGAGISSARAPARAR